MTKRFTRVICSNDEYTGSLYCNDEPLKIDAVCTLLNENEQLKQSNQKLNDELQETMGYLALKSGVEKENEQLKQTVSDWSGSYDELFEDIKRLEEENEQLKQAYNDAKKDVEKKEQILKDIMKDNLLIQDIEKELEE